MAEILQGSAAGEARLLADDRFIRKVASLYYEEGNSQEAVAEMVFCSRQTVSKALQKARERGIVRITVVPDMRLGYLRNLSRDVRVQLGLEDLILASGQNMNTIPSDSIQTEVVAEITSAAADYLDQMLTASDIVAISGGKQFMRNLVRFLRPARTLPQMQVVASIGFVSVRTNFGDANLIAYDLAQAYGASHLWFPCPAFLNDPSDVDRARQMPVIRDAYTMMKQANVVVTSLWSYEVEEEMVRQGILTQEQQKLIESYRPVADINHWLFDASGRCINEIAEPFPYSLSGLDMPGLKDRIKQNRAKVILVAGGSSSYIPAIRAVLKAGIVNILITDHVTAQVLLMGD